jgi:acetyltransferase
LKDELGEETAEFAILVRSRQGSRTWLAADAARQRLAKENGLRRVYGDVLIENTTMLQMCAELGFHVVDMESDIRRVVLNIKNTDHE